ncbi:hypothetical protein PENSPDRAFT_664769 [Peniophora sp. CONT]|nr:hypothetical protein PENSPDRAFT_664769 [Peniophora sp. CONT]
MSTSRGSSPMLLFHHSALELTLTCLLGGSYKASFCAGTFLALQLILDAILRVTGGVGWFERWERRLAGGVRAYLGRVSRASLDSLADHDLCFRATTTSTLSTMDPATPDLPPLTEDQRSLLEYIEHVARAEGELYARGMLALCELVVWWSNPENESIDMPQRIYELLWKTTRDRYFEDNYPNKDKFVKKMQTIAEQKKLSWQEGKYIPHSCCTKCGQSGTRTESLVRHGYNICYIEEGKHLEKHEMRALAVDAFLPCHIADTKAEWDQRLKSSRPGTLPSLMGIRDILPFHLQLMAALNEIIAEIPPSDQIMGAAPPPASIIAPSPSAMLPVPMQMPLLASPLTMPVASTSNQTRKRKAGQDHAGNEDAGDAEPKRARRGNATSAADAGTVPTAAASSSASTAPVFSPQPTNVIPIDPSLLAEDAANAAASPASFFTTLSETRSAWFYEYDWDQIPANPPADTTDFDNEVQVPETSQDGFAALDFPAGGANANYSFVDAAAPHPSSMQADLESTHSASGTPRVVATAYNVPVAASSSSRDRSSSLFSDSEGLSGYSSTTAVNSRNLNAVDVAEAVNAQNAAGELPYAGADEGPLDGSHSQLSPLKKAEIDFCNDYTWLPPLDSPAWY